MQPILQPRRPVVHLVKVERIWPLRVITNAWFVGGYGGEYSSTVQRITYATDTATASVRGPLSSARYLLAAAGNTTDGWFGGGGIQSGGPVRYSTVDRITYATDTATASVRGPLSTARIELAAASNISL